ncbi:hypothetical protein FRB96_001538 [Tulasnella sp. 330]|nr:hypothetical protein FRB96_001538 [Tulasnella sp. 330]KAG8886592.1 hypothetical protein FRB97_000011 [Tulasnella sp. 331]
MLGSIIINVVLAGLAVSAATLDLQARDSLTSCLTGTTATVQSPGQSGFATASLAFNRRLNYTPAAIAYPTTAQEVASIVQCGAAQGLSVTARSGGHSYAAFGLGGENNHLVVDLSQMKTITIADGVNAVAQTGARLGDIAQFIWLNGQRALPHGTCPYVGIGGHTAYGGFGLYSRKAGLLLDRAISAEVVLANGTIVTASNASNSDLFFALRGAAPSFGIVTAWTYTTDAAPTSLINYEINFPGGKTNLTSSVLILNAFQTFAVSNPDPNLSALMPIGYSDSANLNIIIQGTYYGTTDQFNTAIAPLTSALTSISPNVTANAPTDWFDGTVYQTGSWDVSATPDISDTFFAKSLTVDSSLTSTLDYNGWATWLMANGASSVGWFVQIDMYGGFISTIASNATAYTSRSDVLNFQFYGSSGNNAFPSSGTTDGITFMNAMVSNLQKTVVHAYPNYIDPTLTQTQWESQYFGANMPQLMAVKEKWDPANVFRFPQSIPIGTANSGGISKVLTPGQTGFSNAVLAFNRRLSYTPAAITYPYSPEQVATIVKCGAAQGMPVTARSGGHSYAAYGLGGEDNHLVIDLSQMKAISMNTDASNNVDVVTQTGNRLGELAQHIWNNGSRALPHGTCPEVGLGGHVAYGGFGPYSRKSGLLLDHATAAEVVLSDGQIVTASATSHTELFFALRGAAPSYGIVTAWTFRTDVAPPALINYEINFPSYHTVSASQAILILTSFQSFAMTNVDTNLSAVMPIGWQDSQHLHMDIEGTYYGTVAQLDAAMAPFMQMIASLNPIMNTQAPANYYDGTLYQTLGKSWSVSNSDSSDTFFAKSLLLNSATVHSANYTNWVNWMIVNGASGPSKWWCNIDLYGGVISNVADIVTAYANRNDILNFQFYGSSGTDEFPSNGITFLNNLVSNLQSTVVQAYPCYIDPTLTTTQWTSQYYATNLAKLIAIKKAQDPTNVFRFPQSIPTA